jgi:hypothetical protein
MLLTVEVTVMLLLPDAEMLLMPLAEIACDALATLMA